MHKEKIVLEPLPQVFVNPIPIFKLVAIDEKFIYKKNLQQHFPTFTRISLSFQ